MFNAAQYQNMYSRFMGPLAQPVILMINNGAGWDSYPDVMAHVSRYRESDLIPGGSIRLGDLRLVILAEDLPAGVTRMGLDDRIEVDGRALAVINWDSNTRSVGDTVIAIEAAVRG